jgi:serine/threonine-protein kinase
MVQRSEPPGESTIVAGKYRLVGLLGRGGMGSVWEGIHTTLGTRVAVKFIEAEFAGHAEVRDRFFNEAFAAARLQSKHIVQVYDHGVDEGGRPYIVMEFLSGEALDQRLVREGTLTLQDTARLLQQVCRAVKKAHEEGIIHRDLKPENVFLVWDEEDKRDLVKVVDFGIAKFTDRSGISSATRTGAVIGTPHFMSPEQARGLKSVDERADVWSIGVIAYRATTGVLPFDGEAVGDLLVKICTAEPLPPSSHVPLPEAFDRWMARALAKTPEDRFRSVQEQAEALLQAADLAADSSLKSGQGEQKSSGRKLQASALSADTSSPVAASNGPNRSGARGLIWALGAVAVAAAGGFLWRSNSGNAEPGSAAAIDSGTSASGAGGKGPVVQLASASQPQVNTVPDIPPSGVPQLAVSPSDAPRPSASSTTGGVQSSVSAVKEPQTAQDGRSGDGSHGTPSSRPQGHAKPLPGGSRPGPSRPKDELGY